MFVTIDTIETSYASSSSGPGAGELEAQELVASLSNYRKKLGRTESTLLNSLVNLLPELSELRGNLKQRNRLIIELKHEVEARCTELDNVRTQLVMLRADFKEYRDQVAKDRKEQEEEAKIAPAKEKNKKDVEQSQLRKKIKQENVEEAEEATSSKLPTAKEKQKMKKNNNKNEEESQMGMRIKHEIVAVEEAEEATRNLAHKTNVKAKDREMQVIKHKRIKQEIVEEEPEPSLLEEPVRKKKNNDEELMYYPPTKKRIKREVMELGEEESSQPTSSNTLASQLLVPPQVPPPFFGQAIHQHQPLFFFQTPPILINGRNIYPSMPMPPFPLQQQQQPLPPPMPLAKVKIPKVVTQKRKKRAKRKGKKVTLKDPNKVTPKKKGGPPKTYKVQSGMFKGAFAQMKKHRDKQTTLYKEALIEFEQQPKQNNRKKLRCLVAKMVQKDWDGFWSEL